VSVFFAKTSYGSMMRSRRGIDWRKKNSWKSKKKAPTRRRYGRPPRRSTVNRRPPLSSPTVLFLEREESFSLLFCDLWVLERGNHRCCVFFGSKHVYIVFFVWRIKCALSCSLLCTVGFQTVRSTIWRPWLFLVLFVCWIDLAVPPYILVLNH